MKTYKKTIDAPQLEIFKDTGYNSPREWNNLGYFITVGEFTSPDQNTVIENIVKTAGDIAESAEDHIELIKKEMVEQTGEEVAYIYPTNVCFRGGRAEYERGIKKGRDYSNNGFYIVPSKGRRMGKMPSQKEVEDIIDAELDIYTKYVNGEVYGFTLYDENGEEITSDYDYYDIEDIREKLGEEWKNENLKDYIRK